MKILQIVFLGSCLTLASCLRRPSRTPSARPKPYFPTDLRSADQTKYPELRIPSERFCSEMNLRSAGNMKMLLLTPWWYNYCAKMYEKEGSPRAYSLSLYRDVLNQVQAYKKKQNRIRNEIV